MLACARIGAIHSVVFGGFASGSLASRIDDAEPKVVVSADAGSRAGKVIAYKPLLDEAIRLAAPQAGARCCWSTAASRRWTRDAGRDEDYAALRERHLDAQVPCAWLDSTTSELHALHQRHDRPAERRAARHRRLRGRAGGEHEAHLLRPGRRDLLLHQRHRLGRRPQLHRLRAADRRHGDDHVRRPADPARRRHLVAAGREVQGHRDVHRADRDPRAEEAGSEVPARSTTCRRCARCSWPASRSTSRPRRWIAEALGKPIIDNYWQTESGWPILDRRQRRRADAEQVRQPGRADVRLRRQADRRGDRRATSPSRTRRASSSSKGRRRPASCRPCGATTRASSRPTGRASPGGSVYNTFDWGIRDADGYYFILGRTDDVINVAGHRLGTREIEESISSHPNVAEVAVVGVADALKGQVAMAFVIAKDARRSATRTARLQARGRHHEDGRRPARRRWRGRRACTSSPRCRRRARASCCGARSRPCASGRDPGDLTTIEDPAALQQIRELVEPAG